NEQRRTCEIFFAFCKSESSIEIVVLMHHIISRQHHDAMLLRRAQITNRWEHTRLPSWLWRPRHYPTRSIETRSFPNSLVATLAILCSMSRVPRAPLKLARFPTRSSLPSRFYLLCRASRALHSSFLLSRCASAPASVLRIILFPLTFIHEFGGKNRS